MQSKVALVAFFSVFLLLLALGVPDAQSQVPKVSNTDTMYFHVDPNSSYKVGTINTGGAIFNSSSTLGFSPNGNAKSGVGVYNQIWYLSQLLVGPITVGGTPGMTLDLYASAASTWNYTIQIIEVTSSGSTVAVLSTASCSNTCLPLTTSQALYTISGFSLIYPGVTIPANNLIEVSIVLKSTSGSPTLNFVVERINLASDWTLPLLSPPVTVSVPTVGPANILSTDNETISFSVTDSFDLLDVQNITVYVYYFSPNVGSSLWSSFTVPLGSLSASSFTAAYSTRAYSVSQGSYRIVVTVYDNSGNGYNSVPVGFSVSSSIDVSYIVWTALLETSIIFSALSVFFPIFKPPEARGPQREGDVSQSPTNALIAAGRITMLVRQLVFPILASLFWFVLANYSAVLSPTFGLAIPYLFFALSYIYLVMTIILGIVIGWGIFWMGRGGRFGV